MSPSYVNVLTECLESLCKYKWSNYIIISYATSYVHFSVFFSLYPTPRGRVYEDRDTSTLLGGRTVYLDKQCHFL